MNPENFENRGFFLGQMDTDTSPEFIENGKYGVAFNIRPYDPQTGSVGTITNVDGNELVSYTFSGESFLRVIGSKLDLKRKRIYWFVFAQDDFSERAYILYYSYGTQSITTVFNHPNILDFSPDHPIRSVDIVYDEDLGDTLFFTDGQSEPKKVNVKAAVNRFTRYSEGIDGFSAGDIAFPDSSLVFASPFLEALLFIPCVATEETSIPPTYNYETGELNTADGWEQVSINECYPPYLFKEMFTEKPVTPYFSPNAKFNYIDSGTSPATNLMGKSFQFKYKYVLFDGQETEWSPVSEAVMSQELTSGVFSQDGELLVYSYPTPSAIEARVPINLARSADLFNISEFPHSMISRVKIAVREVASVDLVTDFLLFRDIPIEDFHKFNLNTNPLAENFPVSGTGGTFYYDWNGRSYNVSPDVNSRVVSISVLFTGSESLVPIDIADSSALFYNVPSKANAAAIIDNRRVWAGVTTGVEVGKDVMKSINDNVELSIISEPTSISLQAQLEEIASWQEQMSAEVINGGQNIRFEFLLDGFFPDFNFNQPFFYSFTFSFTSNISFQGEVFTESFLYSFSGFTTGIPSEFATFDDFIIALFDQEYPSATVIGNAAGAFQITLPSAPAQLQYESGIGTITNGNSDTDFAFFAASNILPERTYKNHTEQEFGFVFQDALGRLSSVLSGEWAKTEIGHFVKEDFTTRKFLVSIQNLGEIIVPPEARVMHILRKRSGSYRNYVQFSLSKGNCPTQSWNFNRAWHIGFINLEVDDFSEGQGVFDDAVVDRLYFTLNSISGQDGGSYDTLFGGGTRISDTTMFFEPRTPRDRQNEGRRPDGGRTSQRGGVFIDPGEETVRFIDGTQRIDLSFNLVPQKGDFVRFLYRANDDGEITHRYDSMFVVQSYSDTWNTVAINFNEVETKEPALATFLKTADPTQRVSVALEVIRPRPTSENEFYWEVAAQLSCTNGKVDTISGRIAILGDAYIKPRVQCVTHSGQLGGNSFRNFVLNDRNYSDFYPSNNVGEGRPNAILESVSTGGSFIPIVKKDNVGLYSEKSIQNTDRRLYANAYDANILEFDNIFGMVELLDAEGDVLNVYQEDKRARIFAGKGITTELSGAERVLATQSSAFSDIAYQAGVYGISQDATSFAKSGYRKYYTDSKRGRVYRESMDGITDISAKGMENHFKTLFKKIRNSDQVPIIRGFFDEVYDEYVLITSYWTTVQGSIAVFFEGTQIMSVVLPDEASYFPIFKNGDQFKVTPMAPSTDDPFIATSDGDQVSSIVRFPYLGNNPQLPGSPIQLEALATEVAVFSEKTGGWTTFMSYDAEWASSGIQSHHTFVNGQMWIHEFGNTNYNTFHGREFPSLVDVISNRSPELTKFWLTAGIKTKASKVEVPSIETSEDQVSFIPADSFENREGTMWSEFYGDGEGSEVIEGDRLRGRWLKATVQVPVPEANTERVKVFSLVFNSNKSGFTQ